jgi:hypothetical protein
MKHYKHKSILTIKDESGKIVFGPEELNNNKIKEKEKEYDLKPERYIISIQECD